MQRKLPLSLGLVFLILLSAGCDDSVQSTLAGDWLIPENEIFDGGPGRDGIPALENPELDDAGSAGHLEPGDLVIGIYVNNEARAYPHKILDWHEIINDDIENESFAVTYCPLTGSGIGWNRNLSDGNTTFGVSGLLYNSNLIPYDRQTGSNWTQMGMTCINGSLAGEHAENYPLVETTWETWQELYPNTRVVSTRTGYDRNYGNYPYGNYKTDDFFLLFPVGYVDRRLPLKERVLGVVINKRATIFQFEKFTETITVLNLDIDGVPIVVVGSREYNFAVAFERSSFNDSLLEFSSLESRFPSVMVDNSGTTWDLFGNALDGEFQGEVLVPTKSFIAYWFAWGTFYIGADIYDFN